MRFVLVVTKISLSFSLHSVENNGALLSHGVLLKCSSLLVSLGGAVAERDQDDGMELVLDNTLLFGPVDLQK